MHNLYVVTILNCEINNLKNVVLFLNKLAFLISMTKIFSHFRILIETYYSKFFMHKNLVLINSFR